MRKKYVCTLCAGSGEVWEAEANPPKDDPEAERVSHKLIPCPLCKEKGRPPFVEVEV